MTIKRYFLTGLLAFLIHSLLSAGETVLYGSSEGWGSVVSEGLQETEGWRGKRALTLAPLGRNPFLPDTSIRDSDINPEDIDLLLLAEPDGIENPDNHYRVEGNYEISSQFSARGKTSIRFGTGGIELYPSQAAMWSAGKEWEDFTLDFRLRPIALNNGDVFLSWRGREKNGALQTVTVRVENRRFVWEFRDFFRHGARRSINLELISPPLIPGEWRHHRIRFKRDSSAADHSGASPGLLEYLVDGVPVDMIHATPSGREGTTSFYPFIGSLSNQPVRLAPSFRGYIDEFRLTSFHDSTPPAGNYSSPETVVSGTGYTLPVDSGFSGSIPEKVRARVETPGLTQIRFFIRTLEHRDEFNKLGFPVPGDRRWKELTLLEKHHDPAGSGYWYEWKPGSADGTHNIRGRYFSLGYILEADPVANLAPVLSVLEMEYIPRLSPHPPGNVRWYGGDNTRMHIPLAGKAATGDVGRRPEPGDYVARDSLKDAQRNNMQGNIWIPRGNGPGYEWPSGMGNTIIDTSVHAVPEGRKPSIMNPGYPEDYQNPGNPVQEMSFRP